MMGISIKHVLMVRRSHARTRSYQRCCRYLCAQPAAINAHSLIRRHVERKISSFSEWHQVSSSIPMLDRLIAGAFLLSEITITPIANHSFHAFRSAQAANEVPPSSRRTPLFFHRDLALTR